MNTSKPNQSRGLTIVDVETTGLDPGKGAEVVELGLIHLEFDLRTGNVIQIHDVYAGLQQPATPIPAELTQIHGVSNAMVRGKQLDLGRVQLALSSSQYVVAHNAQFDRKFVESIPGLTIPSWLEWRCSCWGISWKKQVGLRNHKLASVRRHLGISDQGAHEALSDVYVVARLLEHQHLFSSLLGERFEEPTSRPKDWIMEIESRMRLFNRPAAGVP